jgi:hypothetical protein
MSASAAPGPGNPGPARRRRLGQRSGDPVTIRFEDRDIEAWPGESVAAALLAAGETYLRTAEDGGARGLLCGIGVCWECRCVIDGRPNQRACMAEARPGMKVRRQEGLE